MMLKPQTPACMRDAPDELVNMARVLATTCLGSLVDSMAEAYPGSFDVDDSSWRDLVRGVLLMQVSMLRDEPK